MNAGEAPAFSRSAGEGKTGVFAALSPCFPRKTSEKRAKDEQKSCGNLDPPGAPRAPAARSYQGFV